MKRSREAMKLSGEVMSDGRRRVEHASSCIEHVRRGASDVVSV
jgi:hypothetical protein